MLIDTSSWTHALRRNGDPAVRTRVQELLANDTAAWCEAVRLELWSGVRGEAEKQKLRAMEACIPSFPITAEVWGLAIAVAATARDQGLTVPAIDLLIFACARFHGVWNMWTTLMTCWKSCHRM